jgi:hypothetical protein
MRKELKKRNEQRLRFRTRVERFGTRPRRHDFPEPTVLLVNLRFAENDGRADHLWFTVSKTVEARALNAGDTMVGIILEGQNEYRPQPVSPGTKRATRGIR